MSGITISGTTSTGLVINHGTVVQVEAGGTLVDASFNGGIGFLEGGSVAFAAVVAAGGQLDAQFASVEDSLTVDSGGIASVDFGGTALGITVNSGGTFDAIQTGTVSGIVVNAGGTLDVMAGGTAAGIVVNGGTVLLDGAATVAGAITFAAGAGGTVVVAGSNTAPPTATELTYSGFGLYDTIDFRPGHYSATDSFTVTGDTLTLNEPGLSSFPMVMLNPLPGIAYTARVNPIYGNVEIVACFAAGTRIATADGERAVERLQVGDLVRTACGGVAPVRWLGQRIIDVALQPNPAETAPVRIRRHAFGAGRPCRDLRLSPDHAVFIDGALIPVRYLVNGATILRDPAGRIAYWHVELPAHDVLLAEGLPCESYLDTGNRAAFANGGGAVMLHPDFARRVWQAQGCAPLVLEGAALTAARRRLIDQAGRLGWRQTGAPDLHLCIDGVRHAPRRVAGLQHFDLPAGARVVHLVSRAGVPAQTCPDAADHRRLGVAVAALLVNGHRLALQDARLGTGWHAAEAEWRWTDGCAALALAGATQLGVGIAMTERYWLAPDAAAARAARFFATC